jgi:hypothetical protein
MTGKSSNPQESKSSQGGKTSEGGKKSGVSHPGMMGDGTEEQNLSERGDPSARIKGADVKAAFKSDKKK